jgi:hypothetical protein
MAAITENLFDLHKFDSLEESLLRQSFRREITQKAVVPAP